MREYPYRDNSKLKYAIFLFCNLSELENGRRNLGVSRNPWSTKKWAGTLKATAIA